MANQEIDLGLTSQGQVYDKSKPDTVVNQPAPSVDLGLNNESPTEPLLNSQVPFYDMAKTVYDKTGDIIEKGVDMAKDKLTPNYGQDNLIEHPQAGQEILNKPIPVIPLNADERRKLGPQEYKQYMDSLDDKQRKIQEDEDARLDPMGTFYKKLSQDPILGFTKGLGDTAVKNQILGLAKVGSYFSPSSQRVIDDAITTMNTDIMKGAKVYDPETFYLGTMLGRNATQVAAAFYSGGSIPLLMTYETGAALLDMPAQPSHEGKPLKPLYETGMDVGTTAALAGTAGALSKVLPYVFRGFQSKNLTEALNPTTEMGRINYEQLADAIEYADEHGVRLSNIMVRSGGSSSDGVAMVAGSNYFVLREMFKGSDEFAAKSLDMLQDLTNLGKKYGVDVAGDKPLYSRRESMLRFQKEVKTLRDKYRKAERLFWNKVNDKMPDGRVELHDFNNQLTSYLTREGIDDTVVNYVKRVTQRRFQLGHKELMKEADAFRAERKALKDREMKFRERASKFNMPQEQYVAKLRAFQEQRAALTEKITGLNQAVKISPKDLLHSIQLINKKINVPGGNISVHDAQQLRGLRMAKDLMEKELNDMLEDFPEAKQAWTEAKDLTKMRVNSFGSSVHDEDLVLTNALLDKDTGKVLTMLKDPDKGLQHMEFIKKNFGANSQAFHNAVDLYLKAKLNLPDTTMKLADTGHLVSGVRGKFKLISNSFANITPADIKFLKQNVSEEFGSQLNGYMRLVNQYDNLIDQTTKLGTGRGQMPGWMYGLKNPGEILSLTADFISYMGVKGGQKLLGTLPTGRAIIGGGLPAIFGDSEDEDYYKNIIEGAGIGYATGIAGRHIFEQQIEEAIRIVKRRKNPGEVVRAIRALRDRMRKTAKALEDKKLLPDEKLNQILKDQ